MGLTREEIEAFKREHLRELELEESRRAEERNRKNASQSAPEEDAEAIERARETQLKMLKEEIEEQFYKARGYKRYVDHRGAVLWLTPEEYAFRVVRRKRNEANTGGNVQKIRRLQTIGVYIVVALIAMAAGLFLTR